MLLVETVLIVSACEALDTVAEYATSPRKATARTAITRDIPTILPDILLLMAWSTLMPGDLVLGERTAVTQHRTVPNDKVRKRYLERVTF